VPCVKTLMCKLSVRRVQRCVMTCIPD
jgi:hypothetical protein